jgi:hypothetical protein
MVALGSFVVILLLSLIVVRVATVALSMTGLATDVARFQARSAWTGTGFTTGEAEQVVNHPVRRRILSWLMVARGAGLVSAASTLVLSFADVGQSEEPTRGLVRFLVLLVVLLAFWLFARSSLVDRWMRRVIEKAISVATDLETRDYSSLLRLAGGFDVSELKVDPGDWLEGRTLEDLSLAQEGVLVLGVTREDGSYVGSPAGGVRVRAGDVLTLYARREKVKELDRRVAGWDGEEAHARSRREELERREALAREESSGEDAGEPGEFAEEQAEGVGERDREG